MLNSSKLNEVDYFVNQTNKIINIVTLNRKKNYNNLESGNNNFF
jgi:hypothetical protein